MKYLYERIVNHPFHSEDFAEDENDFCVFHQTSWKKIKSNKDIWLRYVTWKVRSKSDHLGKRGQR